MEEEVQTSGDPSNCLMWFPREVSASLWTATGKQFHQTTLAWHIMEKVKNESSWICSLCLWASWQMRRNNHIYQKEHHFAMDAANHTCDSSLLILLWRGNDFLCFNKKLISKSPITQIYKNVFASRFLFGKIQHFNYIDTITLYFYKNVITAISSLRNSLTI